MREHSVLPAHHCQSCGDYSRLGRTEELFRLNTALSVALDHPAKTPPCLLQRMHLTGAGDLGLVV